MNGTHGLEWMLSILFLPVLNDLVSFAWGRGDPMWLAALKRTFLLLPVLAIILGYWTSVISVLSVVIREKRKAFVTLLLATWWDLGRAIATFWGGVFRFVLNLFGAVFSVARLLVVGTWVLIHDVLLIPFRVIAGVGGSMLNPGVPWIAVALTMFWCFFEAVIFTYVMSPLVIDTMSNMTGNQLTEGFVRLPLFLFMLFIVLGSYSVLSTWTQSVRNRDVPGIIKVGAIEAVALFVEVVFLYREFVDALVPWFAQHSSGKFELGITGTLVIASMTWFGIRSLSWFLFASTGTPPIMAIIQGKGLDVRKRDAGHKQSLFSLTVNLIAQVKAESDWMQKQGENLLACFILPPLQVVAAAVNFCTVLVTSRHLFDLPLNTIGELESARVLVARDSGISKAKRGPSTGRAAS